MTSGSIVRWCSRRNSRTATAAQGPSGAHPLATKAKPASGETAKNALHRRPLPGPCRPGLRPLHARSSPLPSGLPREPNTGAAGGQRPPLECRYRDASQRGTTSDSRSGRRPPPLTGTRAVLVPVTAHIRAHPRTSAHIRCAERRPSVPGGPLLHTREVAGSKPAAPMIFEDLRSSRFSSNAQPVIDHLAGLLARRGACTALGLSEFPLLASCSRT